MTTTLNQREPIDRLDILEHELAMVNRTIAHFVLQRERIQERLDQTYREAGTVDKSMQVQQAA